MIFFSEITFVISDRLSEQIHDSYAQLGEKYYLTNEDGKRLGEGTYISTNSIEISEEDYWKLVFLEYVPILMCPIYSIIGIIAVALLFYKNRLQKPIIQLRNAAEKVSQNDLNFVIDYRSEDELGKLCVSFECMRAELTKNLKDMWREIENREKLNATFAHDLRTPLTVIKGYSEMLQENKEFRTVTIANKIKNHVNRIESYVESMSHLCNLEAMRPDYKRIVLDTLISSVIESATVICKAERKRVLIIKRIHSQNLDLDKDLIFQVSDNLVSNATRYADTTVTICFEEEREKKGLKLVVSDDGKGFSENGLYQAVCPYFTEEKKGHLGLGLHVSKLFCEKHGGYLKIINQEKGAQVTAFFKSSEM